MRVVSSSQNYHVVAVDMRGYGDSEKPAGIHSYYLLSLVEDLRQLVAGLGKQKFHLVAHDWGGFVCWTFATMVLSSDTNFVLFTIY